MQFSMNTKRTFLLAFATAVITTAPMTADTTDDSSVPSEGSSRVTRSADSDKPDVGNCFCCSCRHSEPQTGIAGKRAKVSVGTSRVKIQWGVPVSFFVVIVVALVGAKIRKLMKTREKPLHSRRLKIHAIFKAVVSALEKAVSNITLDVGIEVVDFANAGIEVVDFAILWSEALSADDVVRALFDWTNPSDPSAPFAVELKSLIKRVRPAFRDARMTFADESIVRGTDMVFRLMKFYDAACAKTKTEIVSKFLTEEQMKTIKNTLENAKSALAAMERAMSTTSDRG